MALLEPGHFHSTHFPSGHWQTSSQHWLIYGTYVPPVVAPVTPSQYYPVKRGRKRRGLDPDLLMLIKQWLEVKQN